MVARLRLVSCLIVCFLFLLFPSEIFPAENSVSVKASVDKPKISQDELLTFKIEIAGDLKVDPQIELPGFKKDFDIVSTAQTQSLQFKGREALRQVAVIYVLAAKLAGKFTIGGATVKIGKESFKTESIDVEVTPSPNPEPALPQNPPETEPEESNPEEQVIL